VTDAALTNVVRDSGRDSQVSINGASVTGDGLSIKLNTAGLSLQFTLQESFNHAGTTSFAVTGGGALFQLGGGISTNEQKSLGIPSVAASELGDSRVGFLSQVADGEAFSLTSGHAAQAQKIVRTALDQLSSLRGRLGALQKNTIDTNVNQLQISLENLTSAES